MRIENINSFCSIKKNKFIILCLIINFAYAKNIYRHQTIQNINRPLVSEMKHSENYHSRLESQAKHGNVNAQVELAKIYEKGLGIKKDYQQARKWYEKAAQKGNIVAQVQLANLYFEGLGGPKDDRKAKMWFEKAAGQGDVDAQFNLGMIYEREKNKPKAVYWLKKACQQGDSEGCQKVKSF